MLPVLSRDHQTVCGWLYGACVIKGEVVSLPALGHLVFTPVTPEDEITECESCGEVRPLWAWSDAWAGWLSSISGVECEDCIKVDDGDPTQGWVPSPLALTSG
jgi:hypothetical protein